MKRTTYKYQEAFEIIREKASQQGEPKIPNTPFPFVEIPEGVLSNKMGISRKTAAQYLIQLEALGLVALARTGREISGVYILAKGGIPSPQARSGRESIITALSLYKKFSSSTGLWWVSPDDFHPAQIVAGLKSSREFYRWIEYLEKDRLVVRVHKNGGGRSRITSLRLTENFPGIAKT